MPDSVKVKLVNSEFGPGYRYAEIHTKQFTWIVDPADFGVIHGLSRVVRLIPDKVVTSRILYEERIPEPYDSGWLIQLVLNLLTTYRQDHARRQGPIQREQGLRRYHRELVLALDDGHEVEEGAGVNLNGTIDTLQHCLTDVQQSTEEGDPEIYWQIAESVAEFADQVREICLVYTDLVHPLLIRAGRGIVEAGFEQNRCTTVKARLERDERKLVYELRAQRDTAEREREAREREAR